MFHHPLANILFKFLFLMEAFIQTFTVSVIEKEIPEDSIIPVEKLILSVNIQKIRHKFQYKDQKIFFDS